MSTNRRTILLGSLAAILVAPAKAAPLSTFGFDAAHFGVRAGATDDQTGTLQRAIDQAARTRAPLMLAPGVYRAGGLTLPAGAQLAGVRGATRFIFTHGPSLLSAEHAETVSLNGLMFDGGGQKLPEGRALVHFDDVAAMRIADCALTGAGGNAVTLNNCDGEVTHNTITGAADNALFCNDSRGLVIAVNIIAKSGNGGIRVFQSDKRYDGTLIADNRIEDTAARAGGSGENGNAINVFRAGDVIVHGNHIRNAAFSAIRGNSASNIQIVGNTVTDAREVALYSEFAFEGAIIANNVVDGCSTGVSVANFNEGGRLAIVQGNIIRNTRTRRYPGSDTVHGGVGIYVEADSNVTGNVIENAPVCGINAGWGKYLRDVNIANNIIRDAFVGIGISAVDGTGKTLITGNLITNAPRGAIVGFDHDKPITGDLAVVGASGFPKIVLGLNTVQ